MDFGISCFRPWTSLARVPFRAGHSFAARHVRQRMRKRGGHPSNAWPSTVADPGNSAVHTAHTLGPSRNAAAAVYTSTGVSSPWHDQGAHTLVEASTSPEDTMTSMMPAPATVKDRTKEFNQIVERSLKTLAARGGAGGAVGSSNAQGEGGNVHGDTHALMGSSINSSDPSHNQTQSTGTNSEFAKMSSRIGHGIHGTSQKLERLTQLAKRSSMFDDPAKEIAELSAVIKSDITALNTAIAELQNHAARVSSTKQGTDHSVTVVDTLKTRLMGATKSFKEVLTMRQENVKSQNDRRKMFSNESVSSKVNRPNPFARQRDGSLATGGASANFPRLNDSGMGGPNTSVTFGGGGGFLQPGNNSGMATGGGFDGHITGNNNNQMQSQMLLQNQDSYMSSRSEALQNVERTITELGGIFQQLSTMVAEQGEMAIRIDENVEQSVANVDNAQTQLLKYLNSVSSNRWLIMKIFGVLISFLVFFVVFIA